MLRRIIILLFLTQCAALADGEVRISVINERRPGSPIWVNTKVQVSFLKGKDGQVLKTVKKRRKRERVLTFDSVPEATHVRVEVIPIGYYQEQKTLRLRKGQVEHTFKVKRLPEVRFKVVDAMSKKPIKGATVTHRYRNSLGSTSGSKNKTNKSGVYKERMTYEGKQTFLFSAPNYRALQLELPLEDLPRKIKTVELRREY